MQCMCTESVHIHMYIHVQVAWLSLIVNREVHTHCPFVMLPNSRYSYYLHIHKTLIINSLCIMFDIVLVHHGLHHRPATGEERSFIWKQGSLSSCICTLSLNEASWPLYYTQYMYMCMHPLHTVLWYIHMHVHVAWMRLHRPLCYPIISVTCTYSTISCMYYPHIATFTCTNYGTAQNRRFKMLGH